MRFGLEVRAGRPAAEEFATLLRAMVRDRGGKVVGLEEEPDVVVAVGGDGTMLAAARRALTWDVPVLGFNLGTLGFLAEAEKDEADEAVKRLIGGDFGIQSRLTVTAATGGVSATGVNDVVVEKIDSTRLVGLSVTVDGTHFATYQADGLVVATPTGSTAYSFSAGGPIIDPSVDALVMTPVAAHSLFDRSIVLPSDVEIRVTVSRDRPVKATVDKVGLKQLGHNETVIITRGDRAARFVTFGDRSFPGVIRGKFGLP
ncbi:MAG: NAD(+)/NADH kinase [Acidimicrobiia bacterium]|nr:NAD(+)/NADH kinase [Acidimicrobiia bacterium]